MRSAIAILGSRQEITGASALLEDIYTVTNSAGEVVKTSYVASHKLYGQRIINRDVCETTIARSLSLLSVAKLRLACSLQVLPAGRSRLSSLLECRGCGFTFGKIRTVQPCVSPVTLTAWKANPLVIPVVA